MKELFHDIFGYHHHFNQKLMDLLMLNVDRLTERTIPLMSHIVNAHQIWTGRILKEPTLGVHDLHTLEECKRIDDENFDKTVKILSGYNLGEVMVFRTKNGAEFSKAIRDILFHAANHTTHHRGQIISDLRQQGIEPIATDYIFYTRDKG